MDAAGNIFGNRSVTSERRLKRQAGWISSELLAGLRATVLIGGGCCCEILSTCARIVWNSGAWPVLVDEIVDVQRVWPGIYILDRGCRRGVRTKTCRCLP